MTNGEKIRKLSDGELAVWLDNKLGSGSSRIAAYDLGLDFVGCELDPVYYKLEEERFARHSQQLNLFID